jgi:DNA-binding transcriptional MerR regulator
MKHDVHIGAASRELGVTPEYLRLLERQGRIPRARRDRNGRVYSELDLALLRVLGIGQRPRKLRSGTELIQGADG